MAETIEELTPLKQKLEDFGQFLSKARPCSRMLLCRRVLVPQSQAMRRYSLLLRTIFSTRVCAGHCRHMPGGVADQHPSLQRPTAWRLGALDTLPGTAMPSLANDILLSASM